MRVRCPGPVRLVGCFVLLAACNGDKTVAPPTNSAKPCGNATVQLAVLQAATIACTAGTTVTLQGGGASYLVVPNFATGNAVNRATSYTIGIANGASANVVPVAGPSLNFTPSASAPMSAVFSEGSPAPFRIPGSHPRRALIRSARRVARSPALSRALA